MEPIFEQIFGTSLWNKSLGQIFGTNLWNKSLEQIIKTIEGLNNGVSGDFLAMDIRQTLIQLGEITGEISNNDLLDNIFSNFCIGK